MPTVTNTTISRSTPLLCRLKSRFLLSKQGSTKEVYHITLCIKGSELEFKPGDAVGILPQNPPILVKRALNSLNLKGDETVTDPRTKEKISVEAFLSTQANLSRLTSKMLQAIDPERFNALSKEDLTAYLYSNEPHDLFTQAKTPPALGTLVPLFAPLLPRFYSIASSARAHPDEIHLTVAVPSFIKDGEKRYGTASSFLSHQANEETPIPLYVQAAPHFALPKDETTHLIMIGPGTGVAPFRAFVQERKAQEATGKNWLFFGERNCNCDFYYEAEWRRYMEEGHLKLTKAFSRDQKDRVYVQDRLLENGSEIWRWLQEGTTLYVCGNAKNMAKAVDCALHHIAQTEGALSSDAARAYLTSLRKDKRYLTDVY